MLMPKFWGDKQRTSDYGMLWYFLEWSIDKPMVTIEPTVPSTPLLGLGPKIYPSNKQHISNQKLSE